MRLWVQIPALVTELTFFTLFAVKLYICLKQTENKQKEAENRTILKTYGQTKIF